MYLNIKKCLTLGLILCCLSVYSQEETEIPKDSISWEKDEHFGIFSIALYTPVAIGDNFANVGLQQQPGVSLEFVVNIFESPVLIGAQFTQFRSDVTNTTRLGNYEESTINSLGVVLGYQYLAYTKWRADARLSYSTVSYNNRGDGFNFSDSGSSLQISSTLGYHITKYLGFYGSLGLRRDFLSIDAPPQEEKFFNGATYLSASVGIRIVI